MNHVRPKSSISLHKRTSSHLTEVAGPLDRKALRGYRADQLAMSILVEAVRLQRTVSPAKNPRLSKIRPFGCASFETRQHRDRTKRNHYQFEIVWFRCSAYRRDAGFFREICDGGRPVEVHINGEGEPICEVARQDGNRARGIGKHAKCKRATRRRGAIRGT